MILCFKKKQVFNIQNFKEMCFVLHFLSRYYFFCFQANSEEFIPIFANNPRELRAFLEHMIEVEPSSPQGVYDTLLELRLQDWAHEQETEVNSTYS